MFVTMNPVLEMVLGENEVFRLILSQVIHCLNFYTCS